MRAIRAATLGVVLLAACSESPQQQDTLLDIEVRFDVHSVSRFGTLLTGAQEVPAVPTRALGDLYLRLTPDGTLAYKLAVAKVLNVTQAHIHCGPAGVNGPIILWLYPSAPPATLIPGESNGTLNEGSATDANVVQRPTSAACPGGVTNMADVVAKIRSGGAYANIHTTAFPGGEVRGQVGTR
jgi:hypothetical protein